MAAEVANGRGGSGKASHGTWFVLLSALERSERSLPATMRLRGR